MAIDLDETDFQGDVLDCCMPVFVEFWVVWNPACRMLSPVMETLAFEYAGKVKFCKVNADENRPLAARYSIVSLPSVLIFKGGRVVEQFTGVEPENVYIAALAKYV
jgi:thioredoxin 1